MSEFIIKSSTSDLSLVLSDINGDYFKATLQSPHQNAVREVYAYTDTYGLADLMEFLSSQKKPWVGEESWESLEGEFKLTATCSILGQVIFKIILSEKTGKDEEWLGRVDKRFDPYFYGGQT